MPFTDIDGATGLLVDVHNAPSYPVVPFVPDDPNGHNTEWERGSRSCFSETKRAVVQMQILRVIGSTLPFILTVSVDDVGFACDLWQKQGKGRNLLHFGRSCGKESKASIP